jgi:alpha-L-arabinofuranosidase
MGDARLHVESRRLVGRRDEKIYGHFLEHFHRVVYGGAYEPSSPLSDSSGFRADVLGALRDIKAPVIRWPGGCFVSAYHWKDGVGAARSPSFDKAWRVEEPNSFGTDEFIAYCRAIGAEPYICTNAGSGGPEEMSDWVEYCNLRGEGRWARARIEAGHPEPYGVKYWSIGNENYLGGEMGSKTPEEWRFFVRESAKMMKRVDPGIRLLAASTDNLDWNIGLLREAGRLLDYVSLHGYWDRLWQSNDLSSYEACMAYSLEIEEPIVRMEAIIEALGMRGKLRIAYDEWNLRGWHHPFVDVPGADCWTPRGENDLNSSYTMADAVFSACFLNRCLAHCESIGMANFAPSVNGRGLVFAHEGGIVKRSTYRVFELYAKRMGETVVDSWLEGGAAFDAQARGEARSVPELDATATLRDEDGSLRLALVNRSPERSVPLSVELAGAAFEGAGLLYSLCAGSKDSFNDVSNPDAVSISAQAMSAPRGDSLSLELPPHSVSVLVLPR